MGKFIAGGLLVVLIAVTAVPSHAQLINWSKRQGGSTAPAAKSTVMSTSASQVVTKAAALVELRGMVLEVDKKSSRITVRDDADGGKKTFVVDDPRVLAQLSSYDQVAVSFQKGSNVAVSVKKVQ